MSKQKMVRLSCTAGCCSSRVAFSIAVLLLLSTCTEALRGMGLPNRELFEDYSKPQNKSNSTKPTPTLRNTRVIGRKTPTNSTAGLTMSGLKEELSGIKDKVKDAELRHSKATIIAAATIGSLLLAMLLGCAGMLAYNRFVSSQHGRKKGPSKNPYYDADRLLGDATGL